MSSPTNCTWCARPVDAPVYLSYWSGPLPYHPDCLPKLQKPTAKGGCDFRHAA